MDLKDTGTSATCLILDRDAKLPVLFDQILCDANIQTALTGVRIPRMNAIIECWGPACSHELLDRTLIWNEHHLSHALRQFEIHHNAHRPPRAMNQATPLRAAPEPITDPGQSPVSTYAAETGSAE
ncbi:integrase [Streptomyces sp. NPDC090032]|uniref:integrase n=1 Tax=unclassified Streptomyces TaxID=2593676 RepID=UPI00371139EA